MHARIGAASSHGAVGSLGVKPSYRLLQGLLHAVGIALPLPAAVGGAVVLQAKSDAAQGGGGSQHGHHAAIKKPRWAYATAAVWNLARRGEI